MITLRFSLFVCLLSFFSLSAFADPIDIAVQEEAELEQYKNNLRTRGRTGDLAKPPKSTFDCIKIRCVSSEELKLQALIDFYFENPKKNRKTVLKEIKRLRRLPLHFDDSLQLYAFMRQLDKNKRSWEKKLLKEAERLEATRQLSDKAVYTLIANEKYLGDKWRALIRRVRAQQPAPLPDTPETPEAPETNELIALARDLVRVEPPIHLYDNGRFAQAPRLYMFCRLDPSWPCMMVMKNRDGEWQRRDDGEYWHQPSLGYSGYNKKYNQFNGNTPRGVYRLDGVMPYADQQLAFGKFRRLIMNFIAPTQDERDLKFLLPPSSHDQAWWRETVVARDIGRNALRIHGTGRTSKPTYRYFPFVATAGCIAKRENKYNGVEYIDQRLLLDELMVAQGLEPIYANETKIRALLYVYNFDDTPAPVTLNDLKNAGIL